MKFCTPITHGTGIQTHHRETAIYDSMRRLWREKIESPDNDGKTIETYSPSHADDEREIELSSSRWKAGSDPDTQFYSYNLRIQKDGKTPAQSLSIDILPQKDGMVYPDGNELKLPHGTGTRLKIQTSYPDGRDDVFRRANELLSTILDEYDSDGIDRETAKITKFEKHIRFDREKMAAAVDCLYHSQRLIGWESMAEIKGRQYRQPEGWDIWRFDASEWQRLGFTPPSGDYKWSLKAYSAESWAKRSQDDWMHHPKLEAFYGGKNNSNESLPSIDKWDDIEEFLSHVVAEHSRWTGITRDDLIEDPYFPGSKADARKFKELEGRRDDLRAMYESMDSEVIRAIEGSRSDVPAHLLRMLVDQPRGILYSEISDELNISKETIRYHSKRLEDSGLIERIHIGQEGSRLRFKAAVIRDTTNDVLEELHAGETVSEARETPERGRNRRRYASLSEIGATPSAVVDAVERGELDEDDVRVPDDWRPD
jgi:DNA-binding Lrp family transcriptional regulator